MLFVPTVPTVPTATTVPTLLAAVPSATLGGAVRSVSLVSLLSRLFGLVRDLVIVRLFGDTAVGSAFAAAFAIPNMFRRLLGEGALSAAFIPEYAQAVECDVATRAAHQSEAATSDGSRLAPSPATAATDSADGLATLVIVGLGLGTALVTIIIELVLLGLLLFTGPGENQRLSITLIMVMLPFMPLICITAILAGMLQVRGRMGLSMTGPIVLNIFVVAVGGWYLWAGKGGDLTAAYALGVATVASGITQALGFAWALRRPSGSLDAPGVHWVQIRSAAWNNAIPSSRRMFKRFVPVVIGTGTLQLNAFLDMIIGMWPIWFGATVLGFAYPLDERSNAILSFTTRLYQFPLGVFGIAVATAAFPMLARTAKDPERFASTIRRGIRLSLFVGLPASVGLLLVRTDLIALLFGQWHANPQVPITPSAAIETAAVHAAASGGGFSQDGVARASSVLMAFSIGVWAYALNHLFTRVFYARGDTKTPMQVSIAMVALNLALNCTLIWFFREAGLAWSTSLCAMLQCGVLFWLVRRNNGAALNTTTLRAIFRIATATALMALGVLSVQRLLQSGLVFRGLLIAPTAEQTTSGWKGHAALLASAVGVGAGVFLVACRAMRVPELGWLIHRSSSELESEPERL